jgi:hypothetical protein
VASSEVIRQAESGKQNASALARERGHFTEVGSLGVTSSLAARISLAQSVVDGSFLETDHPGRENPCGGELAAWGQTRSGRTWCHSLFDQADQRTRRIYSACASTADRPSSQKTPT